MIYNIVKGTKNKIIDKNNELIITFVYLNIMKKTKIDTITENKNIVYELINALFI